MNVRNGGNPLLFVLPFFVSGGMYAASGALLKFHIRAIFTPFDYDVMYAIIPIIGAVYARKETFVS